MAEKSFGIHVGAMAGLPAEVVKRAKHIVMDDIACTLAGRKTRKMYGIEWDHFAAGVAGEVTPIGCDFKTSEQRSV